MNNKVSDQSQEKSLEEKIKEILERDCGQTCPNGSERKPSLPKLLKLFHQARIERTREIKEMIEKLSIKSISDDPEVSWYHEGWNNAIDDVLEKIC